MDIYSHCVNSHGEKEKRQGQHDEFVKSLQKNDSRTRRGIDGMMSSLMQEKDGLSKNYNNL